MHRVWNAPVWMVLDGPSGSGGTSGRKVRLPVLTNHPVVVKCPRAVIGDAHGRSEVAQLATYIFRVLDRKAQVVEGTIEAPSAVVARSRLRQDYPSVLSVEEKRSAEEMRKARRHRLSAEELCMAVRQIATMMAAGIPLARSLRVVAGGGSTGLSDVFTSMSLAVESGMAFSKAMRRHPAVFDEVFVRIVESGEVSGRMDAVLTKLADLEEKSVRLRKKLVASFTYPAVLGGTAMATLSVFVFYVLPLMQPVFHSLNVQLPLATRMVLAFATAVRNPWIVGPGALMTVALGVAGFVIYKNLYRSQDFRLLIHGSVLRIPILGGLLEKSTVARVLFTLSTLLDSGVSFGPALSVVEKVAGNEVMVRRMGQARKAMVAGGGVYESFQASGAFPELVLQMIRAGEEAGSMEIMMRRVSVMYEEEVDLALDTLATSLEPLILIGMGVVVGFITMASFMPMVKLLSEL